MLKGLALSGVIIFFWILVVLAVLRGRRPDDALGLMTRTFLAAVPVYFLAYRLTPATLSVFPPRLYSSLEPLGIINGFLVLILLFLTGLQFYNHIHNSISLRLVLALDRTPGRRLTVPEIETVCGPSILLWERIETLQRHHLVIRDGDRYYLTAGGALAGRAGAVARAVVGFAPIREP